MDYGGESPERRLTVEVAARRSTGDSSGPSRRVFSTGIWRFSAALDYVRASLGQEGTRGEGSAPSRSAHNDEPLSAVSRPSALSSPKVCLAPDGVGWGCPRPAMPQRMRELVLSEPVQSRGQLAVLWILPLTLSGFLGVAWGASSLGAPHIHHFHGGNSKHPSVPIAIYRSPASLRGGHGGSRMVRLEGTRGVEVAVGSSPC